MTSTLARERVTVWMGDGDNMVMQAERMFATLAGEPAVVCVERADGAIECTGANRRYVFTKHEDDGWAIVDLADEDRD